jgi:hypothetical protein
MLNITKFIQWYVVAPLVGPCKPTVWTCQQLVSWLRCMRLAKTSLDYRYKSFFFRQSDKERVCVWCERCVGVIEQGVQDPCEYMRPITW